jgi:hypothetical protein
LQNTNQTQQFTTTNSLQQQQHKNDNTIFQQQHQLLLSNSDSNTDSNDNQNNFKIESIDKTLSSSIQNEEQVKIELNLITKQN